MKKNHSNTTAKSSPSGPHPAFTRLRSERIESLDLVVDEYRHKVTGAQHFHLTAANAENVFLVVLRTVPRDSTGVAHILEHTALCGSERYPVRDPFFMMIRRSLNTFMNAFTSSDWTAYPFASQNKKDFNNLMDVYLDAVFFSRLDELDFTQEGHRVEFEKPDDPGSPLVFKGVVFNEMKGAMSSPVSALWQTLTAHLYPTTTYHYNSGGDPEHIPDLSYSQLKAFYRTHYHPSNAVFMTYGDIPAQEHQARFEAKVLSRFQRLDNHITVNDERRLTAPVMVQETYALDQAEAKGDKTHIVLGWLLGRCTRVEELFKAHLLTSVLLDNGASPLRYALENTDLGSAPSPLCGLEDGNLEMNFVCGLEGSKPEHSDALESLVLDTLRDVAQQGVPQDKVEAALHQLELQQREISGGGYPYGLHLIMTCIAPAVHRGDPVAALNIDSVLAKLREEIKDPEFIKRLVSEYLLDNPHRVRLTMVPDTGLSEYRSTTEAQRLAAMKEQLSDAGKMRVVERAAQLVTRQQSQDDPGILPKIGLEDVPVNMNIPTGDDASVGGWPMTFFAQGTNGLVYQQIIVQLPALADELLAVMPYYTSCLTELGCGDRDYLETQAWQDAVSGGIGVSISVRGGIDDTQTVKGYFLLSGKALARNHKNLTDLIQQTFTRVRFDELGRIREIIAQERAVAEQSVTANGHNLAMTAAVSGMSPAASMAHRLRGLAGIHSLKGLDDGLSDETRVKHLAEKFQRVHQGVLMAPRQFLLVGEAERRTQLQQDLDFYWRGESIEDTASAGFSLPAINQQVRQLWITSTQVNFCAKAYATVPVEHPDTAALTVLGGFLRNGFLHRAIREQGGAYGGGAGNDSDVGAFRFYSYRDPRLAGTLDDFDRSIDWLLSEEHQWREVEEAILGVIGQIDKPGSPYGEARKAFHNTMFGRTPEQRRRFRSSVLAVTLHDLQRVGNTYLKPDGASIAVITNNATLEQVGDLGLEVLAL